MHVRPARGIAERIDDQTFRFADPASVVGVFPVVDRRPPDPRRLQVRIRGHDRLGDHRRQRRGVLRVLAGSQTTHRRRRRVRVGRGDHHVIDADLTPLGRETFRFVDQRRRHHAGIDDDQCEPCATVVQHEPAGEESAVDVGRLLLQKAARDDPRELLRRDLDRCRPGPERRPLANIRSGLRGGPVTRLPRDQTRLPRDQTRLPRDQTRLPRDRKRMRGESSGHGHNATDRESCQHAHGQRFHNDVSC